MKKIYLSFLAVLFVHILFAQNLKPIAYRVAEAKARHYEFTKISLFTVSTESLQKSGIVTPAVSGSTILTFNSNEAQKIVSSRPDYLSLSIPTKTGKKIELALFKSSIFTPDFSVTTSGNNGLPISFVGGVHYWGIVDGDNSSLAAISIFNDEVMGLISSPTDGNSVLGKIEHNAGNLHILYNDDALRTVQTSGCFTPNEDVPYTKHSLTPNSLMVTNCIRLFWEVNLDLYNNKGSIVNTVNYVTGLFNQSAIIYANDTIPVELSEIFVWNTTSPYTATTTSALLGQFQSYRTTMNGDLGHLLGLAGGGGIAAGFSGLCASNSSSSKCYSGVQTSFSNVPTYSWSVEVVTHEQGHLMGSRHTHACVWNGNSTAIDNCGPTAGYGYEGSCSGAPTPVGGGTIMSYCHLVGGVGINFSNGFGLQPRTVIKNNFNNASCLTSCIGTACMPSVNMSTTNVTTTTATFNWAAAAAALSYTIRYRVVGTTPWTTDTSSFTTYNASGLTPGANYEWQVQTMCNGGNSIFSISTKFITNPLNCFVPAGLTTSNIGSSSATFNWSAVAGATSYSIQYRIIGNPTWSTGTTTLTTFNVSGLTSQTNYEWQIQTVCSGGGLSGYSASVLFTTLVTPCSTPLNNSTTLITANTASFNFGGVAGGSASSYNIRYRIVGAPSWITVIDTLTPYNATGLTALSNYEWQIQAVCGQTTSAYSSSVLFTTLCATPIATITANGPTVFCTGGQVLLTAGAGIGYSFQWYLNGAIMAGMVSMNLPVSATGNYTVVVTSGTCTATSSVTTVTVNPLPSVSAGNVSGCSGIAVSLAGLPGGGIYSVPNPYSGPSTTYNYTVTDGNGCSNSASGLITILGLPTVTAQNLSGCDGSPIVLSGLPAGGSFSISNPYTGPSTTYTYSYTDGNGCSNTSSPATITVNPLPVVSFSGLAANYTISSPAVVLTGIPSGGTFSGVGISGNTFDPAAAGIGGPYLIIYDYSDPNTGCSNSTSQQTSVANCPVPAQPGTITEVGGVTKVCPGDSRTYKISLVSGATSYLWTPPAGSSITIGQGTKTVTVLYQAGFISSGVLSVEAVNLCGNSIPKTKSISINTPAKPSVISGPASGLCNLTGVGYNVTSVSGITYNWTFNTGNAGVASGQGSNLITADYTPNFATGTLSVTAGNGCGVSAPRTLAVKAIPATPGAITGTTGVCINQANVPYSIVPLSGATTYTWYGPSGSHISDGVTTSAFANLTTTASAVTVNFGTTAGNIKVKANSACGSSSLKYLAVSFICRDGGALSNSLNLSAFPNPASTELHIQFTGVGSEKYMLRLLDLPGKEVILQSGIAAEGENSLLLKTTTLSKGIYFLELKTENKVNYNKIIIE